MKKVFFIWVNAIVLGTVGLCSCSSDDEEEIIVAPQTPEEPTGPKEPTVVVPKTRMDITLTAEESIVNDAANQFSLSFFSQMVQQQEAANIIVSPFSAQAALSMTANGARGETLNQMLAALNMEGFSLDDVNKYNQTVIKAIADLDNTTYIISANGIWSRLNLLESFSSRMQAAYDARVEKTDFSREALIAINDWASEQTHGMIPKLFDENKNVTSAVVLANALYFNAVWKEPFHSEATKKGTFTNADKSQSYLDMMDGGGNLHYLDCGTFDLCEKPYGNEAFSMVFLLPHEGVTLSDCISDLAQKDWKVLTDSLATYYSRVSLKVPKFELKDLQYDLIPSLKKMGMLVPFTGLADFRNMTDEADLFIGKVDQLTALMLNEQGTQAAAITKVEMMITANGYEPEPKDFTLNRPFAFLIKEKSTGVILFAGVVNKL